MCLTLLAPIRTVRDWKGARRRCRDWVGRGLRGPFLSVGGVVVELRIEVKTG